MMISLSVLTLATSTVATSFIIQKGDIPGASDCLATHNVPFVDSTSSRWIYLSTSYNLRIQYQPALITLPETTQNVADSVRCAAENGLKVQPKGGGHSYGSYSSGGQNGSLIVNLENFNNVTVDQDTYIAKVGAGVRLGNMAEALFAQGQRALPHGVCPAVGVGGHATHGGFGYAARMWGLTLDTIVKLEVVLSCGDVVNATSAHNTDIFYAMRGAGDSFGIVTNFYFQTNPAPISLFFEANVSSTLHQNVTAVTTAFQNLQKFVLTSELFVPNITLVVNTDNSSNILIAGLCVECNLIFFNTTVLPQILSGWVIDSQVVSMVNWTTAVAILATDSPVTTPLYNYDLHATFYSKSLVIKNSSPLTESAIQSFWESAKSIQGPAGTMVNFYLHGGRDSRVNDRSSSASAYVERDALWVIEIQANTENNLLPWDDAIILKVEDISNSIMTAQPNGNFSACINYLDPMWNATQAAQYYFGIETYTKLMSIKEKYDPNQVFWNPQSIGNPVSEWFEGSS